jgi:hypothetical protein
MAVKNYREKTLILKRILLMLEDIQNDSSNEYFDYNCTEDETSDFYIMVDTPLCDLISSVESFIENIEEGKYEEEDSFDDIDFSEDEY